MSLERFNPAAIIRKLDFFYECGRPDKARRLLLKPWPDMQNDINCLYRHFLVEAGAGAEVRLFLKSASLDEKGLTYEFPDWITAAGCDLVARYGELEGRLRHQKALAVFAESYAAPDGQHRFEQACAAAAERMTVN
jgi:hypothetical protein